METNEPGTQGGRRKKPAPDVTKKKGRKRDWTTAFLNAFRQIGVLTPAANHAGVSRWAVRKRVIRDPEFARRYNEAVEESTERLEAVAFARATRAEEPSDVLLMFMLKGRKPATYRDNWKIEHAVAEGTAVAPVIAATGAVILLPKDGFEEAARKYADDSTTGTDAETGAAATAQDARHSPE